MGLSSKLQSNVRIMQNTMNQASKTMTRVLYRHIVGDPGNRIPYLRNWQASMAAKSSLNSVISLYSNLKLQRLVIRFPVLMTCPWFSACRGKFRPSAPSNKAELEMLLLAGSR